MYQIFPRSISMVLVLLVIFSTNMHAQKTHQIYYDFKTKKFFDKDCACAKPNIPSLINEGDEVVVVVQNINRLLFDVSFNKEVTTFNMKVPDISSLGFKAIGQSIFVLDTTKKWDNFTKNRFSSMIEKYQAIKKISDDIQSELWELKTWYLKDDLRDIPNRKELKNALDDFEEAYFEIIQDTSDISKLELAEIQKLKAAVDGLDLMNKYEDAFVLFKNIKDLEDSPHNLTVYTSPKVIASGDELKISIEISPREGVQYPFGKEQIDLKFDVRKKTRISFSTGLFYSRLSGDSFLNKPNFNTTTTDVDTVASYTLIKNETDNFNVGVAAYFHYSWPIFNKTADKLASEIGLTLGLGYDFDERFQFLLGPSFIFGRKNRLIVNLGMAIGQVDRLSSGFEIGRTSATKVKFTTRKKWSADFFFGLSYNLNLNK